MFSSVLPYLESLDDPRRDNANKLHKLGDIVFIVFCAVISGIENWLHIEEWADAHHDWLKKYIELPNGIPAHDTIKAVMSRIKPEQFVEHLTQWIKMELPSLSGLHIAVDGKTLRGSRCEKGAVHIVSAFATQTKIVLAQQSCAEKSNEIKAIPDLFKLLDIRGAVVTIDAMGCQKEIIQTIVDAGADYVIALKENQPTLYGEAKLLLKGEEIAGRLEFQETVDQKHGRVEVRDYCLSDRLDALSGKEAWAGLTTIGMVESIRDVDGKVTKEARYFMTSIKERERFAEVVRAHWGIENSQHHILDVQFSEDDHRTREKNAAINLAFVRRMCLNILRRNVQGRQSIRGRKIRAGYDDVYREKLLFGSETM